MKRINIEPGETLVAQWETKGDDYLALLFWEDSKRYHYRGNGQGGVFGSEIKTHEEAIRQMERPWDGDGKPGAGPAFVLKQDRPSLKRIFTRRQLPLTVV